MESAQVNTSSTSLFNEDTRLKPYIEVTVIKGVGLLGLSETSSLKPYIQIYQLEKEWITKYAYKDRNAYVWGEILHMEIDFNAPLTIMALNKDIYGQIHILSSYLIQPSFLKTLSESPKHVQLFLNSHDLAIGSKENGEPMIMLSFKLVDPNANSKYSVVIDKYKNIIEGPEKFTMYEITVNRDDGASWKVKSRYSSVREIRDKLIKVWPELRAVPFPPKTYLNFLGCWCSLWSKFETSILNTRKKGIEHFLNVVLGRLDEFRFDSLYTLLKINPPLYR